MGGIIAFKRNKGTGTFPFILSEQIVGTIYGANTELKNLY